MTGMTGRQRALSLNAGESPTPQAALDELPSGSAVGELIESDSGAHRVPRGDGSNLTAYMQALRAHPTVSREEEHELAVRYVQTHELSAARKLITANLRLVVKIAQEYRRAQLVVSPDANAVVVTCNGEYERRAAGDEENDHLAQPPHTGLRVLGGGRRGVGRRR